MTRMPSVNSRIRQSGAAILLHQARYNLNYHGSIFCGGTGGYTDLSLWKDLGPEIGKAVLTKNLFGIGCKY